LGIVLRLSEHNTQRMQPTVWVSDRVNFLQKTTKQGKSAAAVQRVSQSVSQSVSHSHIGIDRKETALLCFVRENS
jgi:murein L,D-transpeptidase YafK